MRQVDLRPAKTMSASDGYAMLLSHYPTTLRLALGMALVPGSAAAQGRTCLAKDDAPRVALTPFEYVTDPAHTLRAPAAAFENAIWSTACTNPRFTLVEAAPSQRPQTPRGPLTVNTLILLMGSSSSDSVTFRFVAEDVATSATLMRRTVNLVARPSKVEIDSVARSLVTELGRLLSSKP